MEDIKKGQKWLYERKRIFYVKKVVNKEVVELKEIGSRLQEFNYTKSNFNSTNWKLMSGKLKKYKVWLM